MKKVPVTLSVALAALTLFACEKEQEQVPSATAASAASAIAKPELLATGPWHQTGLTVTGAAEGASPAATVNLFTRTKPSSLVKSVAYNADGSYSQVLGNRGDVAAEPVNGKWVFNAAADSLIVTGPTSTQRFAVTELSASTLRLARTEAAGDGTSSTYTLVFSR